jgi:hypothetical protein
MPATNNQINLSSRLFVEHGKAIEEILRAAVDHALSVHRRLGNPIAVWKDGQVEIIPADQIVLSSELPNPRE